MNDRYPAYGLYESLRYNTSVPASAKARFWIVWSPQGSTPPRVEHKTEAEARAAAEDMARSHPNQEFFVLEAKSMSKAIAVETVQLGGK